MVPLHGLPPNLSLESTSTPPSCPLSSPIQTKFYLQMTKRDPSRDLPGGPVVKTPGFHCSGARVSMLGQGTKIPHASETVSHSVVPDSLWPHELKPTKLLCPWDFPGKETGVCCLFLLQGIFLTQESNPGLLHCRQILYRLSYATRKATCLIVQQKNKRERERPESMKRKELRMSWVLQQKISSRPSKQKCRGPRPTVESPLCGENGSLGEGW